MMEEKASPIQVVPQVEQGQTKANQVGQQLNPSQQQQALQSIIRVCWMMSEQVTKTRAVTYEPLD